MLVRPDYILSSHLSRQVFNRGKILGF